MRKLVALVLIIVIGAAALPAAANISVGYSTDFNLDPEAISFGGYTRGTLLYPASASSRIGTGAGFDIWGSPFDRKALVTDTYIYLASSFTVAPKIDMHLYIGPTFRAFIPLDRHDDVLVGFGGFIDIGASFFLNSEKTVAIELSAKENLLGMIPEAGDPFFSCSTSVDIGFSFFMPDEAILYPLLVMNMLSD